MMYIKLYMIFLQIGILAFGGGYATLPLIQKFLVEKYAFIDETTMLHVISISQMTPGPIAINSATFIGMKLGGILGSIIATAGVVTPQILILMLFLKFIGIKNKYVLKMLDGINGAIVALILIATISIIRTGVINSFSPVIFLTFILSIYLYLKGISLIILILFGAVIGVVSSFI